MNNHDSSQTLDDMKNIKQNGQYIIDDQKLKIINKDFLSARMSEKETIDVIKNVYEQFNIVLDPHSAIGFGAFDKHNLKGNNIVLAGYVLVHQFCRIGNYSFAGMGAALNQDLPPYLLATGSFAKTHGLNREGLRRNNFDQNTINALHKAYKLIFRSSNNPTNTKELEALSKDYKEVSELLNFIEKSERGVIQSSKQDD